VGQGSATKATAPLRNLLRYLIGSDG
jgi:hypothetical protein